MNKNKHYLISDASRQVQVEAHVLRYWEDELGLPIPRNELGHRYYTEFHIQLFRQIKQLKEQGYHLFLMSNTSHRFRAFSKNIPSVGYMDGIWISCECGYLKPEREAYVDFFRKMKIEPQESYFVDDSPANIEAGIRLGMRGCVYHQDMPELRRNLREAGIDLKDA
mgnify:FL=1